MSKQELLEWLQSEIDRVEKEYNEQREATKHFKTPGNPYITGLGTRSMTLKQVLKKVEELTWN